MNAMEVLCDSNLRREIHAIQSGYPKFVQKFQQQMCFYARKCDTCTGKGFIYWRYPCYCDLLSGQTKLGAAIEAKQFKIATWYVHNDAIAVNEWINSIKSSYEWCNRYPASAYQHIETAEWLHKCLSNKFPMWVTYMNIAAKFGNMKVLEFIHKNRSEGCSTDAMDWSAARGELQIVLFLHENRTEGCTKRALSDAIFYQHLEVAQFLQKVYGNRLNISV